MAKISTYSAVRSQVVARHAAFDGLIGAALGLLLVSGLVASNLDLRQMMADATSPLALLATVVAVVVVQCAVVASLCGVAIRAFANPD